MSTSKLIIEVLQKHYPSISPVFELGIGQNDIMPMDFSDRNEALKEIDISDTEAFEEYIKGLLEGYRFVGVGGYNEDRFIYRRSALFDGENEPRSIHLGTDVWVPENTKVYNPLDAKVHSFHDNDNYGDYGGTIILEHELEGVTFYTLYGHLSKNSLSGLHEEKTIRKGDHFASIGNSQENGQWPPHLHFQLISDMLDKKGDFFGVAPLSEKEYYLELCMNPEHILKII